MVGLYANTEFNFYSSGVFTGCPASSKNRINHAGLLYGYDSAGNWLIKNSWGSSWGMNGHMILSSDLDCGLNFDVSLLRIANPNSQVDISMNIQYN